MTFIELLISIAAFLAIAVSIGFADEFKKLHEAIDGEARRRSEGGDV